MPETGYAVPGVPDLDPRDRRRQEEIAKAALRLAAMTLPIRTRFVARGLIGIEAPGDRGPRLLAPSETCYGLGRQEKT